MRYQNSCHIKRYVLTAPLAFMIIVCLYGCDFLSGLFSNQEENVKETYLAYREAVLSGDIQLLKTFVTEEKALEFEAGDAEETMALVQSMYPQQSEIIGIEVKGDAF